MRNRIMLCALALAVYVPSLHGQGIVRFVTYAPGIVDAKVTFRDGSPVDRGFAAQLYSGPVGTPMTSLKPLLPTTTFQERISPTTGMTVFNGYVNGVNVTVPDVQGGRPAIFFMQAYDGKTWDTSLYRGQSDPVIVITGFDTLPPADLLGLKGFSVDFIPEPSALSLVAAFGGIIGLCQLSRRGRNGGKSFCSG